MNLIEDLPTIKAQFEALAKELGAKNPELHSEYHLADDTENTVDFWLNEAPEEVRGFSDLIVSGRMSHFPGCCGIGVLHDLQNEDGDPKWTKYMFQLREAVAKASDWGLLQQTHVSDHTETRRVMRQLHWRITCPNWRNPNSGNRVTVWTKVIGS